MKINELSGLWVFYSKENDYRILVANLDEGVAEIKAYEYFDEAGIEIEDDSLVAIPYNDYNYSDVTDLQFDCDYVIV